MKKKKKDNLISPASELFSTKLVNNPSTCLTLMRLVRLIAIQLRCIIFMHRFYSLNKTTKMTKLLKSLGCCFVLSFYKKMKTDSELECFIIRGSTAN